MMGQLEGRAEAIAGEFNSQGIANTMWAYATMGTKPRKRMMGQLDRRAEAIAEKFNSQDIANTMWAICFFCVQFNRSPRFCCFLSASLPSMDFVDQKHLCQLHQVFISCDMIETLHANLSVSVQTLKETLGPSCQAAFIGASVHPSASQQEVSDTLRVMGLLVEDEFRCSKSGASVGWAVEFDGPSHFWACKSPLGGALMTQWHLELLGYTVVSLPFWEWGQLTGSDKRKEYLRGKLHIS
jgi:hypothetical protein